MGAMSDRVIWRTASGARFRHWPLALTLAAQAALAAPPSSAWTTAWADEFNGASLDSTKWRGGALPWGGRHHNDQYASYIMPEDAYLQNGSLWLRCRRAAGNEFGGYPYSEGFVHTDGKKNYTYGYVEMRARFPGGRGLWPAFWTLPQGWPPEFDIAEYFGSDDRMHMGLAYGSSWQDVRWDSANFYGAAAAQWHSYGLEWGPGYAIWYKDGVPQKSIAASYVPSTPMYVILNSGMRWDADASTPFPNHFEVDYCRLYSLPATMVNDNTTGSGLHQFNYVGAWSYYGAQAGAFLNDNHWSSTAQDYFQVRFNGARVDLYAAQAPNHGIAAVSVDGGTETLVDCYSATRADKALLWCSPSLAATTHTLKVRVTGTKHAGSSGIAIPADRVDVWPSSGRLNGTVLGTAGSYGNSGNVRTKALDGDLHSFFDAPVADGAWVGLDLGVGAFKRITKVRYAPRPGYAARMVGGRFQGANVISFSGATELLTITATPSEERLVDQTINNPSGFRFVRYLAPVAGYGNIAEFEFLGVDTAPASPAELTAGAGDGQVALTWNPALGATQYRLRRATSSNGAYTLIASPATTNHVDTTVTNEATYFYVVSATNAAGESERSSEASATPRGPPRLRADTLPEGGGGLRLSWPGWAVSYELWRATNLSAPARWEAVTNPPSVSDGMWQLRLPFPGQGPEFYRLEGP